MSDPMSLSVWKFPLQLVDKQTVRMPVGAKILTVQIQHGELTLWATVEPDAPENDRVIIVLGTGHPNAPKEGYIATVQQGMGVLVWHVFDGGWQ